MEWLDHEEKAIKMPDGSPATTKTLLIMVLNHVPEEKSQQQEDIYARGAMIHEIMNHKDQEPSEYLSVSDKALCKKWVKRAILSPYILYKLETYLT